MNKRSPKVPEKQKRLTKRMAEGPRTLGKVDSAQLMVQVRGDNPGYKIDFEDWMQQSLPY